MELDSAVQDHWKCPICRELLYKPCVNTCGHVFCFWCMFRSMDRNMDSVTPNQCPVCRAEDAHLHQVCEQLHFFLQKAFPVAYQEREVDMQEEETRRGICPQELRQGQARHNQGAVQAPEAPSGWSESNFPCSACAGLLFNPVVLNCGHAVCHATCRPQAQARTDPVCPRCDVPVVGRPAICTQWQDQLLQLLPQQMQLRGAYSAAALSSPPLPEYHSQAAPNADPADAAQQGPGGEDTYATAASRLRRRLQDFSNYAVGCDACGLYPIKGRRYTCTDCPDKMGYDLCGKCYNKELHVVGRFNQQHTPDHNMSLVSPWTMGFWVVKILVKCIVTGIFAIIFSWGFFYIFPSVTFGFLFGNFIIPTIMLYFFKFCAYRYPMLVEFN